MPKPNKLNYILETCSKSNKMPGVNPAPNVYRNYFLKLTHMSLASPGKKTLKFYIKK